MRRSIELSRFHFLGSRRLLEPVPGPMYDTPARAQRVIVEYSPQTAAAASAARRSGCRASLSAFGAGHHRAAAGRGGSARGGRGGAWSRLRDGRRLGGGAGCRG